MDKGLYQIAARACLDVYLDNTDLGTTEIRSDVRTWNGRDIQVLAIAGTNELGDWWKNFKLWSKQGVKLPAYNAAHEAREHLERIPWLPLMVCGHSKAGATAIAYKRLFGADYCIAFSPARSLRYWTDRALENTTIFIDPDDPVPMVGCISFGHPVCTRVTAVDDHLVPWVSDHYMTGWVEFTENMG